MKLIEAVIVILFAVVLLQDVLQLLGRRALLYPCYIVLGLLLGPLVTGETVEVLRDLGEFGFIFLLFLIGLEIELPDWREASRALLLGLGWVLAHTVLLIPIGLHLGLSAENTLICLTALTACSVGMAHSSWEHFPHKSTRTKQRMLLWMVALEVLAVLQFAAAEPLLENGLGWNSSLRLLLTVLTMVGVCWLAPKFARSLQIVIEITERWRLHFIVLLVLAAAAFGERLGLSAPKTAFFLGLFISRATHESLTLEKYLQPVGQNLLIPVFFIVLGLQVPMTSLWSVSGLWALGTCAAMLLWRTMLYRTVFHRAIGDNSNVFHLVGPNLSLVALAVHLLHKSDLSGPAVNWPILTGLFFTIASIFLLPKPRPA